MLSACGGGSSDSPNSTNVLPTQWQRGVYPDPSSLKNYCESPRASTSTASYPDRNGSNFLEKMWLRSWSNDVYLWYRELSDIDVDTFNTPREYFGALKTNALTASGAPRDQFHFYYDTAEYNQIVSSGSSIGYGVSLELLSTTPPRKAIVRYVEPNSPADIANVSRGAEIVSVDGVDFINANTAGSVDIINNGLVPRSTNEFHTFEIIDTGSNSPRTITLSSANIVEDPVQNTTFFTNSSSGEKVGYLTFNTFGTYTAEESLANSFAYLADTGVSDLVLDLRYNGGGFLAISSQLAYMIAGPNNTANRTYYKPVFNDKYPTNNPISGDPIQEYPFFNTGLDLTVSSSTALPTLNLDRVFVLTTASTCSASEALMNGLMGIGVEVIQIGEKTCGKPYGFQGTDNCGTTYFSILFKGVNEFGFGDYEDGFYPANSSSFGSLAVQGCEVADDLYNPLGNVNEAMVKAALQYRDSGTCPDQSGFRAARKSLSTQMNTAEEGNLLNDNRVRSKLMLKQILLRK